MAFFYPGPVPFVNFTRYLNQVLQISPSLVSIAFTSVPNPSDPGWKVTFSPQLSPAQIAEVNDLIANPAPFGGWTQPAVIPDFDGFRHDCITDPQAAAYPVALIYCLLAADPTLSSSDRKTLLGEAAVAVNAAYPAQGPAIVAKVEGYLTNRNIPY